jgi:hypothetical protein
MRQPQNAKRGRGRGRRGNGNAPQNVPNRNTSYESNGPEVKLRGNALQLNEKYMALALDAAASGERITAEAYTQFADHYFRLHQAAVDAAEERKAQHEARSGERGSRNDSNNARPAPGNSDDNSAGSAAEKEADNGDSDAGADAGAVEVVDLGPAQLAEIVQEDQDSAPA